MKITESNFLNTVEKIGLNKLPNELQQAFNYLKTVTADFTNWKVQGEQFLKVKELAFEKLEEFLSHNSLNGNDDEPLYIQQAKEDAAGYKFLDTERLKKIYEMELMAELEEDASPEEIKIRKSALEKELRKRGEKPDKDRFKEPKSKKISNSKKKEKSIIEEKEYDPLVEIRFFDEFTAFKDKVIARSVIKGFVVSLQQAIEGKQIRKFSPYAELVRKIQAQAVKFANETIWARRFKISDDLLEDLFKAIADYDSKKAVEDKKKIKPVELSGTEKAVKKENVLCSTDFTQLEFKTLGFSDKWLHLIGDPSPGFTAMVFGKPKMGKSFFCVEFAGYLARNFGKVLYVAKEEKLDKTLQEKLKQKNVAHENLFVTGSLPKGFSEYDFVFLDSVNSLDLSAENLRKLKENNPGTSFVFVFQTTKAGNFRGANTFQHDVDIIIEVPEKGKAVQNGRYNQGGEIDIFSNFNPSDSNEEFQALAGNKNKKIVDFGTKRKPLIKQSEQHIFKKTQLLIPLKELAKEVLSKGTDPIKVISLIHKQTSKVERVARALAEEVIDDERAKAKVKSLHFYYNDSNNISHGISYFNVELEGTESELRKIAGEDKFFYCDW